MGEEEEVGAKIAAAEARGDLHHPGAGACARAVQGAHGFLSHGPGKPRSCGSFRKPGGTGGPISARGPPGAAVGTGAWCSPSPSTSWAAPLCSWLPRLGLKVRQTHGAVPLCPSSCHPPLPPRMSWMFCGAASRLPCALQRQGKMERGELGVMGLPEAAGSPPQPAQLLRIRGLICVFEVPW